jgi:SpoVK/Ycf46/Vps4 family AAA+-type ATPase
MTSASPPEKLASGVYRWTRKGLLSFPWTPGETLERLVLTPAVRTRLVEEATRFGTGNAAFHSLRLPWRRGVFLFGDSGVGKTAASRGLARALDWAHLTLPAHEILNAHLLERALAELSRFTHAVLVLEDVERMISRMENEDFFSILDHAMERSDGLYWVATSRHPDLVPKMQLLRPGRFDFSLKLGVPSDGLRRELIRSQLLPLLVALPRDPSVQALLAEIELELSPPPVVLEGTLEAEASLPEGGILATPPAAPRRELEPGELELEALARKTERFDFAQFEELRALCAGLLLAGKESEVWPEVMQYIQDQLISGDRLGGLSDETEQLRARVEAVDPRVLMAALDQTDVFKVLIEKVIGDAAERSAMEDDEV